MPAKCSDAQKTSGNVAGCLLDGQRRTRRHAAGRRRRSRRPKRGRSRPSGSRCNAATPAAGSPSSSRHSSTTASPPSSTDPFGPATETSVKTFQSTNGLEPTGIVDQATAEMLGILETAIGGPFPPTGWNWLGWGYNKSPALADWETLLVGNTSKFGPVAVNQVRSMPEAQPLFEGFLREIVARGYKINDLGTYVFRCTSNSRKSCEGLTKSSLGTIRGASST
ncbi:MAG: peptidoglycan-binding domain-containing protein [Ilumatobacteraceae bacterium]